MQPIQIVGSTSKHYPLSLPSPPRGPAAAAAAPWLGLAGPVAGAPPAHSDRPGRPVAPPLRRPAAAAPSRRGSGRGRRRRSRRGLHSGAPCPVVPCGLMLRRRWSAARCMRPSGRGLRSVVIPSTSRLTKLVREASIPSSSLIQFTLLIYSVQFSPDLCGFGWGFVFPFT